MSKRKKKMSLYKKSLIIFTLLLLILGEIFLIYVNKTLKAYEKGDIDNYLTSLLNDIKSSAQHGNIDKYFELNNVKNEYEKKPSMEKGYKELLNNAKLSYKKTDTANKYELYADDVLLANVTLDGSKEVHRLGLLTYTEWQIDKMESYNEDGLFSVEAYIKSDDKLFINDIEVKETDLVNAEMMEEYKEVYDKVNLPKLNHYKITSLTTKPNVVIKSADDSEIKPEIKNGIYYSDDYFKTDDREVAMQKLGHGDYNPLEFAQNWSLFLTADLGGNRYGLGKLTPNLIEGTTMYNRALSWATQVDITFTSIHTLDKDTFTGVKVNNFTIYNENAFSVEIYLEKNMTLADGQKKKDILHDVFYYVWYDGAYRLVHMQAVTE